MRVTIKDRALIDASGASGRPADAVWWLIGIEGWYSAPAPRVQSDPVPDGDGTYMPERFLVGARTLAIKGAHIAETSSLARAESEDWVAALRGTFPVLVEDAHGLREAEVFQSAVPTYRQLGENTTTWTVFCTAPDPVKYGPVARFDGVVVENAGRADVLPWRILTTGRATSILVVLGGHRIRWIGDAENVVIDTRDGTAHAGAADVTVGLVEDSIPLLPPGQTSMHIATDAASCVVEVRPGWL